MIRILTTVLALAIALPAAAQDTAPPASADAPPEMSPEQAEMMQAYQQAGTPGPQHAGLAEAAGTYDVSIRSWSAPGGEPSVETGTATREMILDGRVMVEQMQAKMYGQPFTGHGMQGYDNVTGKWWGTWNDSMTTGLMVSQGDCDAQGNCTFTGSWHDPVSKQEVSARMTTRWTSPSVEVFEMYAPGPDGNEFKMMEMTYTRR